jgi:endonuclease V-like protein UPF0215 family
MDKIQKPSNSGDKGIRAGGAEHYVSVVSMSTIPLVTFDGNEFTLKRINMLKERRYMKIKTVLLQRLSYLKVGTALS